MMLEAIYALAKDEKDRALLRERVLSATPAALMDVGASLGITRQAVQQREAGLRRRMVEAGLDGRARLLVASRRRYKRVELENQERALLLEDLARHGYNVEALAEFRLMPSARVAARIDALGIRERVRDGRRAMAAAQADAERERLKDRLAAHGYSVCAAFSGDGAKARAYEQLHNLGLVEWLVKERDRTGNQPDRGIPLLASTPKPDRPARHGGSGGFVTSPRRK